MPNTTHNPPHDHQRFAPEDDLDYSLIPEAIPQIVWITHANGDLCYINSRWREYSGCSLEETQERGWNSFLAPEDVEWAMAAGQEAVRAGERYEVEYRLRRRDGVYRWFLSRGVPMRDTHGHISKWFGTCTDIEEQKQLAVENARLNRENQAALRQSEETRALLDTLLETAPVGFAFFDTQLRYVRINEALARINGLPARDHIGHTVAEALPDMSPEVMQDLRHVLESGEPVIEQEVVGITPAAPGEPRYWLASYYPVGASEGSMLGIGAMVVEITERKRSEAHIEALNERLQRAMTETHHRVKNNLQLMAAMVDMRLMEDSPIFTSEEMRQLGTHIRALAVVHDLLTQEAKEDGQVRSISAKTLLDRLLPLLQYTTHTQRFVFTVQELRLHPKQGTSLALVVNELISNALKHGRGEVSLTLIPQGAIAVLEVCDDGPGFPPDFDPARAANTGLELVENLTRLDLGGTVRYETRPKGGARVRVTISLTAE